MVIGAFPAAKLGALLIKQISKPIAEYIKYQAKTTPFFRTYICMPPAQFYNWCEVKTKMWILNLGKPVNIPVLNEAMAIELGANLLGEAVIFLIASALLIAEYNRSSKKEAAKERAKQNEMNAINTELQELFFQMEEQKVQIKELLRTIYDLQIQVNPSKRDIKNKNKDDSEGPSPPSSPSEPPQVIPVVPRKPELEEEKPPNLLMRAAEIIDSDFLQGNYQRDSGILALALNHLYKDVYNLQLSMY